MCDLTSWHVCYVSLRLYLSFTNMAPPKSRDSSINFTKLWRKYANINFIKSLIFDPAQLGFVSVAILAAELFLNIFVVQRVRYTEIDWVAYMQECEGFLNGTLDYSQLRGQLV